MKETNLDETLAHFKPLDKVIEREREAMNNYVVLEDIKCVDSRGNVFEQYEKLGVAKDIERDENGKPLIFTTYEAIRHFEQKGDGWFLPSFALHFTIYHQLYQRKNSETNQILQQYVSQDKTEFINNTISLKKSTYNNNTTTIHYPTLSDYSSHAGLEKINEARLRQVFKSNNHSHQTINITLNSLSNLTGLTSKQMNTVLSQYEDNDEFTLLLLRALEAGSHPTLFEITQDYLAIDMNRRLNKKGVARGVKII